MGWGEGIVWVGGVEGRWFGGEVFRFGCFGGGRLMLLTARGRVCGMRISGMAGWDVLLLM